MTALQIHSELVSPSGSINSAGVLRQLGRPNLDTLAVLVRETVQNSWDARCSDHEPIDYAVFGTALNAEQIRQLGTQVFAERANEESLPMNVLDGSQPLHALIIADRGTLGLAGPTRADLEGTPRNFVSFLRDVGLPSEKQFSGGTYGFGKASLYAASGLKTILVYTRCSIGKGQYESRFIASSLGRHFTYQKRNFTGRHWWGRLKDGIAEPIINDEADSTAHALGIGRFSKNETGTVIMVLDPLLSDRSAGRIRPTEPLGRTPLQAMNLIAEYLLCFFWPKMLVQVNGEPSIRFHVRWSGQDIRMPTPSDFAPLTGFVEAMERLKGMRTDQAALKTAQLDIASERPKMALGRLSLQQVLISKTKMFDIGNAESPFTDLTHHTALMRRAELVVKYLEGKPFPSQQVGYAGVFVTSENADSIYAASEPPTHDDWNPKSLTDDWEKRYVNIGLTKIRDAMTKFAQITPDSAPAGILTPLGTFATWLGESLIPAEEGPSARLRGRALDKVPHFPIRVDRSDSSNGQSTRLVLVAPPEAPPVVQPVPRPPTIDAVPSASMQPPLQGSDSDPMPSLPQPSQGLSIETELPLPMVRTPPQKRIRGQSTVEIVSDDLVEHDGHTALLIRFNINHAQNADGTSILIRTQAVLDDQRLEDQPPEGGTKAAVQNWVSPDDVFYEGEDQIYIAASVPDNGWQVLISLPDDMIVNVDLEARAESR